MLWKANSKRETRTLSDKKLHSGTKVRERMITESIPDYAKQSVSIPSVTANSQVLHTPRLSISFSPLSILHLRSWGQWEDFTSHHTTKTQSSPKTNASQWSLCGCMHKAKTQYEMNRYWTGTFAVLKVKQKGRPMSQNLRSWLRRQHLLGINFGKKTHLKPA